MSLECVNNTEVFALLVWSLAMVMLGILIGFIIDKKSSEKGVNY